MFTHFAASASHSICDDPWSMIPSQHQLLLDSTALENAQQIVAVYNGKQSQNHLYGTPSDIRGTAKCSASAPPAKTTKIVQCQCKPPAPMTFRFRKQTITRHLTECKNKVDNESWTQSCAKAV